MTSLVLVVFLAATTLHVTSVVVCLRHHSFMTSLVLVVFLAATTLHVTSVVVCLRHHVAALAGSLISFVSLLLSPSSSFCALPGVCGRAST